MKSRFPHVLCLVALFVASFALPVLASRPNVVLIMADDMGYECLRSNGGTSYDSSMLDQLAAQGMRFTRCYSQPVCTPSRNKIMTGRSNARNYKAFGMLSPDEITFGHVMKQAGNKTCIVGKWQLSGGASKIGTTPAKAGFDESCMWAYLHNLPAGVEHTGGWEKQDRKPSRYWHPCILENGQYRPTTPDDYGPDIYTQFIIDFIQRNKDEPFFVYYPMALTHSPYYPTPHSDDLATADKFKSNNRYFGDMVSYTGVCVRRIVDQLESLGLAEHTLVIFTTDNGTGRTLVSQMKDRTVIGGKGLPIDAGCHVPMFARWKGTVRPASSCDALIDFSDFLPTIAALGQADLPTDRKLDGRSFLPLLRGESGEARASVVMHYDKSPGRDVPDFRRVRFSFDGRYKLYHDGKFFDVPNDWEEVRPLTSEELTPQLVAVRDELQSALDALPAWHPDNSGLTDGIDQPTRMRRRQLRSRQAN